nr:DUF1835 domain-containing protein [Metabacillus lacus]
MTFEKGNYKRVTVIFGDPVLRQAVKELNFQEEDLIIAFQDQFAVGPIKNLETMDGQKERSQWLRDSFQDSDTEEIEKALAQLSSIPENVPITIWMSENAQEETGFLFIVHFLSNRKNSLYQVNSAAAYKELFPKKSEKYLPPSTRDITLEELKIIYTFSRENQEALSDTERAELEAQWLSVSNNSATLRVWENGEIKCVPDNYFDDFIIEKARILLGKQKGYVKSARLIGEVYGSLSQYAGDNFFEYRLRKLIQQGIFEYEGTLDAMIHYSIKLSEAKNQAGHLYLIE